MLELQFFWSEIANLGLWQSCDSWIDGIDSIIASES